MYHSGQVWRLGRFKGGKQDGLWAQWHENGQKMGEQVWKGLDLVSKKWRSSKGEEVETSQESRK